MNVLFTRCFSYFVVSKSVVDTQLSPTLEDRKTALDADAETANKIWESPSFLSPKKRHGKISVNVATQSPSFLDQKNSSSAAVEMVKNDMQSPSFLSPTKHHAPINYTNLDGQLSKSTLEELHRLLGLTLRAAICNHQVFFHPESVRLKRILVMMTRNGHQIYWMEDVL